MRKVSLVLAAVLISSIAAPSFAYEATQHSKSTFMSTKKKPVAKAITANPEQVVAKKSKKK